MGFSSALQGRAAHEALIVRQDAELRLMETMKRSIQMKAKSDKEYAISLSAVAQQGLKIDRADEMQGSQITKSWRSYMDELDQQAKQFKTNAELLEVVCEKLTHLSQDKRKARKAYQEEHAKIAARLNHLTDEVVRKKAEYQKHLEGYKALRTRFEEHYIKSGRGGRKLDDVRDKYQKACRKLHLTHNEYVLSITEAVEVEKDFRTVLLPGLLEHQQSVQESFILLWKNILQETIQHSDFTSDKFKEIQNRIDNVINSINPNEEYREFTEKHKTSPTSPLVFQFDESLIEDIPGKLQASTLTVDNLTVDWLRTRLMDLELSVKDCQERQLKMIEHVNGGSPIANGTVISNGSTTNGIQSIKDSQNRQSKDLNALRCQEKQKQKLVDMIKCALNEVGCEELPSGCDDHLEPNFIENGFNNDQQNMNSNSSTTSASVSILNELRRRGGVLTLLRGRHFKRKSTPQPTTPTTRARTPRFNKLQPRSQSLGSLSVNTSPARYEPITNPLRMAASVEAHNSYGLHEMEFESVIVFERGVATKFLPKLRRTQFSQLCLAEEPFQSTNNTVNACSSLDKVSNTNNNNNNNIYTDLEMGFGNDGNNNGDCESIKSGELALRQENVKIEINREDSINKRILHSIKTTNTTLSQSNRDIIPLPLLSIAEPPKEEPIKNSIDAHLDKIDELNRALDDRLKRCLPLPPVSTSNMDLDAIEAIDAITISRSNGDQDFGTNCCSKRTSSSSSDCRPNLQRKDSHSSQNNNKKRSMSFSQKSINAILTNIKEFSKSPLGRLQKSTHTNNTAGNNELLRNTEESITSTDTPQLQCNSESKSSLQSLKNESLATDSENSNIVNPSGCPNSTNSELQTHTNIKNNNKNNIGNSITNATNPSKEPGTKLKFKVPKIQKKSKAIRNTFRSKLINFQLKRGKLCKICTKRQRIHPSKSVFDFAREFNISNDGEEFCTCPQEMTSSLKRKKMVHCSTNTEQPFELANSVDAEDEESSDDVLSMKEHCYCVPSLATSVSSRQPRMNARGSCT